MVTHEIRCPLTGTAIEVSVSVGDTVTEGDLLVVIESMKMENEVFSEVSGTVTEGRIEEDQNVSEEAVIVVIRN